MQLAHPRRVDRVRTHPPRACRTPTRQPLACTRPPGPARAVTESAWRGRWDSSRSRRLDVAPHAIGGCSPRSQGLLLAGTTGGITRPVEQAVDDGVRLLHAHVPDAN